MDLYLPAIMYLTMTGSTLAGRALAKSAEKAGLARTGAVAAGIAGAVWVPFVALSVTVTQGVNAVAMVLLLILPLLLAGWSWVLVSGAIRSTEAGWAEGGIRLRLAIVVRSLVAYLGGVAAVAVLFALSDAAVRSAPGSEPAAMVPLAPAFILGLIVSIGPYLLLLLPSLVMARWFAWHPYRVTIGLAILATLWAGMIGLGGFGAITAAVAALVFMGWNAWRPLRAYLDQPAAAARSPAR